MFELLGVALAIAAFIFSRKAINQIGELREKLDQLEARFDGKPVAAAPVRVETPTAPIAPTLTETPRPATPVTPEPAPSIAPSTPVAAAASARTESTRTEDSGPGLEERLGTRWVV